MTWFDRADLPGHWDLKTMGDIADVVGGSTPKSKQAEYWGGDIPWLGVSDLTGYSAKYISHGARSITRAGYDSCSTQMVPEGTVLFSSRAPIGYVAIAKQPLCTSQGFKSFVLRDDVSPDYVYWYLKYARPLAESMARGTTFKELSGKGAASLPIPLPPRAEQDSIVASIEDLLDSVEAGLACFRDAVAGSETYERSLFVQAFSGGLAPPALAGETADFLLERLEASPLPPEERHPHWPAHWRVARLGDLSSHVTSGSRDWKPYYERGTGVFVLTQNVRMRRLDVSEPFHVDPPADDPACARSAIALDDLLVTIVGANVGNTARVPQELSEHYVCQSLALVRPRERAMSRFLELFLASPHGGQRYFESCFYGQGRPHISFADLKRMPVPVPPLEEQAAIVKAFDHQIAALDLFKTTMDSAGREAGDLTRSILHQAFTGATVKQAAANNRRAVPVGV